jgi:hypothetical protein
LPCGRFSWGIAWDTNARKGFIVQEIRHKVSARDCIGRDTIQFRFSPRYWEAWSVNASGQVLPQVTTGENDMWGAHPINDEQTRGEWSKTGEVHWVPTLDPRAGFAQGAVPGAGPHLLSTKKQPTNLGPTLLTRHAAGTWDCCGGTQTHRPFPRRTSESVQK